jgi:hypothetical protein
MELLDRLTDRQIMMLLLLVSLRLSSHMVEVAQEDNSSITAILLEDHIIHQVILIDPHIEHNPTHHAIHLDTLHLLIYLVRCQLACPVQIHHLVQVWL